MLEDSADLKALIEHNVERAVQQYVDQVLAQSDWQTEFETRLQQHLQHRITARFANLSAMPEIQHSIEQGVRTLFEQGRIPAITQYIDQQQITRSLTDQAHQTVSDIAAGLQIDPDWLDRVELSLRQALTERLLNRISDISIDELLVASIDTGFDRWQHRFMQNFRTKGIVDTAQNCELTVMDGAVVLTSALAAPQALIEQDLEVQGTVKVRDLVVTGLVNVDCEGWQTLADHTASKVKESLDQTWTDALVKNVFELSRQNGISFDSVLIGDTPLVTGNQLSPTVTDSNIKKLGLVQELKVSGDTDLTDTLHVRKHRLGINSREPDSALAIWDEEVALSLGKHSKDHAFVGTSRLQKLVLGVNRQQHLVIDEKGLVSVRGLRIDRWQISHHDTVPGWSGTKGDIVFNNNPSEQAPMGWSCLGGYRWRELWTK